MPQQRKQHWNIEPLQKAYKTHHTTQTYFCANKIVTLIPCKRLTKRSTTLKHTSVQTRLKHWVFAKCLQTHTPSTSQPTRKHQASFFVLVQQTHRPWWCQAQLPNKPSPVILSTNMWSCQCFPAPLPRVFLSISQWICCPFVKGQLLQQQPTF